MKPSPFAVELMERYLFAVRRELPTSVAADVTRELRSLIDDRLQEFSADSAAPDVPQVTQLLRELGAPSKLARQYQPARALIGPALYPLFIKVVKIVLAGAAGVALLTVGTSTAVGARGLAGFLDPAMWLKTVVVYYQLVLSLFAHAVIIFALVDRFATKPLGDDAAWDPRDLPELPPRENEYYGVARAVPRICALVLLALAINLFADRVGFPTFINSDFHLVVLSEFGLRLPLLWVNAWLAALLALRLLAFSQRRFTRSLRWIDIALNIAPAAILLWMAALPVHSPTSIPALAPLTRIVRLPLLAGALGLLVAVIVESIELLVEPRECQPENEEPTSRA
jgi:hypothetical protein